MTFQPRELSAIQLGDGAITMVERSRDLRPDEGQEHGRERDVESVAIRVCDEVAVASIKVARFQSTKIESPVANAFGQWSLTADWVRRPA